jgi:formylglycine-generating enzyme required for sulfatase activity
VPTEPLGSLAWYDSNSNDTTHPVATKLPNGFGLWDMLGNVWEWVQDAGKELGEHILKGGSFYNSARDVRALGRSARHLIFATGISASVAPRPSGRRRNLQRTVRRTNEDIAFYRC